MLLLWTHRVNGGLLLYSGEKTDGLPAGPILVLSSSNLFSQKFGSQSGRYIYRVSFFTGPPPKISKYRKVNLG